MILTEIKHYLKQARLASMRDLCIHFHTDEAAMQSMLSVWERKGKIKVLPPGNNCGDCCKSMCEGLTYFQWVG